MSRKFLDWAAEIRGVSFSAKSVLFRLADRADDRGVCWPSQSRMAKELGCTDRTVRNAITELTQKRLIEILEPPTPKTSARYRLIGKLGPAPHSRGEPHSGGNFSSGRSGTPFHGVQNNILEGPEQRTAELTENYHQTTIQSPSSMVAESELPERPQAATAPDSAVCGSFADQNAQAVPPKLWARPSKVTYQDRVRWNEELRDVRTKLKELQGQPAYRRTPDHRQKVDGLKERETDLHYWLDERGAR